MRGIAVVACLLLAVLAPAAAVDGENYWGKPGDPPQVADTTAPLNEQGGGLRGPDGPLEPSMRRVRGL